MLNKVTAAALIGLLACAGSCKKDEPATAEELCAPGQLTNRAAAAPWATKRAGVLEYVYEGDVFGGPADVYLYGEDDALLGRIRVGQLFGADEPDGSMEAIFDPDGDAPLRLLTKGRSTHATGYTLQMRLQPADGAALHITAEFEETACWAPPSEVGPPCANAVPLDDPAFTLPSCGLLVDDLVRGKRPPVLARLTYAIAKDDAAGAPSVGGIARVDGVERYVIDVFNRQPTDRDVVAQWLDEAGLDGVIGSEQERLLTTAYLDRTWWQLLESHVAYCDLERLRAPTSDATQRLMLCPGGANKNEHAGTQETTARSFGEPHIVTFDGFAYDLQAAGEFIAVESTTDDPFQIQLRYEPMTGSAIQACRQVTLTTGIATMVGERRITVADEVLRVDGEVMDDVSAVDLPEGAELEWSNKRLSITWPGGEQLTYYALDAEFSLPESRAGQVRGLLGQFDGVPTNDLQLRDGVLLDLPTSFELLHGRFADSWRVGDESLFDYDSDEQPGSFDLVGYPEHPATVSMLPEAERDAAKVACEAQGLIDPYLLDACILDVVCLAGYESGHSAEELAEQTPAPPIYAVQPLGTGLIVVGDIRPMIEPIEPFNPPTFAACTVASTPTIALFDEQIVTLSDAIEVDLAEPGVFERAAARSTAVEAGTTVRVVHLAQQQLRELPLHGTVRFDAEILGVIVEPDTLAATDGTLGAPNVTYPTTDELRGLRDGDAIALSEDRRTLDVRWGGDVHHRLRVVLKHQPGGE